MLEVTLQSMEPGLMHMIRDILLSAFFSDNLRDTRIMSRMHSREQMVLDLVVHSSNEIGHEVREPEVRRMSDLMLSPIRRLLSNIFNAALFRHFSVMVGENASPVAETGSKGVQVEGSKSEGETLINEDQDSKNSTNQAKDIERSKSSFTLMHQWHSKDFSSKGGHQVLENLSEPLVWHEHKQKVGSVPLGSVCRLKRLVGTLSDDGQGVGDIRVLSVDVSIAVVSVVVVDIPEL